MGLESPPSLHLLTYLTMVFNLARIFCLLMLRDSILVMCLVVKILDLTAYSILVLQLALKLSDSFSAVGLVILESTSETG